MLCQCDIPAISSVRTVSKPWKILFTGFSCKSYVMTIIYFFNFYLQVMITCGPPPVTRPSPYNDFAMNNPAVDIPIAPNPAIPLDERLLQFVGSLDSSKSVFRDLPVLMCSQGNMATDTNQDCWNGETRGE